MPAFETDQLIVRDLLSEDFVFSFPMYQRPYRWSDDHAQTFLNDLISASEGEAAVSEMPPYFIGSIVLVGNPSTRDRLVIDGRQRLTTLTILIAVLRDIERRQDVKDELHEMLFDDEAQAAGIPRGPRLVADGIDGKGLLDWVIDKGATLRTLEEGEDVPERVERIIDVVQLFRNRLTTLDDSKRIRLRDFLVRRCELVAVLSTDEQQGLRIFKILNTRGLPLSEVDLIKPDLLTPLAPDKREQAIANWEQAETLLGGKDMARLMRVLYSIYARSTPSDDAKRFHEQFIKCAIQQGLDKVCLQDIQSYAELLSQIDEQEVPCSDLAKDPNVLIRGLVWLGWDSEDWLPLAVEIVMKGGEDEAKIYRWLQALDRICYLFFLTRTSDAASRFERREVFQKALHDLNIGRDPAAAGGPLTLSAENRRRMLEALSRPLETAFQRRAIMQRLEAAKSPSKLHPRIDDASPEHVLPQRPQRGSEWSKSFGDRPSREYLNALGNLALLNRKINEAAANRSFSEKKRIIFRVSKQRFFETAKDLRGYESWTPAIIKRRTEEMAHVLAKEWELV